MGLGTKILFPPPLLFYKIKPAQRITLGKKSEEKKIQYWRFASYVNSREISWMTLNKILHI
jgi:hypothetical protein